jgi:hypothetical protein
MPHQQVEINNLEQIKELIGEQSFELHRIADWLYVIAEEMRTANDLRRERPDK